MNYILNIPFSDRIVPYIIAVGTKILSIEFKNVRVIDSYSFLPMPLSAFSSTFQISEVKKGYFPHYFNTLDNQSYIGEYPDPKYYGIKYFSKSKRDEFKLWYESVKSSTFNFKDELISYCESDVELLAKGCLKFREIIIDISSLDPFQVSITIASLCHKICRQLFMLPNSIAVIPETG